MIGFYQILLSTVASFMGNSLFVIPKFLAEQSLIIWILITPLLISIANNLARLNYLFPDTNGPAGYIKQLFGYRAGFIIGNLHLIAILSQQALILQSLNYSLISTIIFLLICTTSAYMSFLANIIFYTILGILKFLPYIILLFLKIIYLNPVDLINTLLISDYSKLSHSFAVVLFAFGGIEFNTISHKTQIQNPKHTISKALRLGTIIAICIFILAHIIFNGDPVLIANEYHMYHIISINLWLVIFYSISFGNFILHFLINELYQTSKIKSNLLIISATIAQLLLLAVNYIEFETILKISDIALISVYFAIMICNHKLYGLDLTTFCGYIAIIILFDICTNFILINCGIKLLEYFYFLYIV